MPMTPLTALLLLQAAPTAAPEREIVVTARPLAETERALRECIARACPPDQEVAAALAHAENQFVGGDYASARATVSRTIGHVRGRAKDYPVAVGDIWRAKARISEHQGESDTVRIAAVESLAALRKGLGPDDPRVLTQRIEYGDALARLNRPQGAVEVYNSVAERARKLGNKVVEGHALLRAAMMWTSYAEAVPGAGDAEAREAIRRVMETADPDLAAFRDAAGLLDAKLAERRGDKAALDRVIASYRTRATSRPTLLYAPPLEEGLATRAITVQTATGFFPTKAFEDQWIDIGFWVRPDGGVGDAEVLRGSDRLRPEWVEPFLRQIRGRRYAPLAMDKSSPGLLRVERVTWTSHYFVPTGTLTRVRDGKPRIVVTDLTVEEAPSKG